MLFSSFPVIDCFLVGNGCFRPLSLSIFYSPHSRVSYTVPSSLLPLSLDPSRTLSAEMEEEEFDELDELEEEEVEEATFQSLTVQSAEQERSALLLKGETRSRFTGPECACVASRYCSL